MPPLGALSEADLQLLNDPTRSVKRAKLVSLCRKASLKAKGTNAELIAALTAVANNNVADQENIDPLASISGKDFDDQEEIYSSAEKSSPESSFNTITYYNSKPEVFWSESTPVPSNGRGRKSLTRRKSAKTQSTPITGLYPQLSVYPNLSEDTSNVPTTSTEDFGKIADNILEEMSERITVKQQPNRTPGTPPVEPIFKDIIVPLNESPFIVNTESKDRFNNAHNKIFNMMDPVTTHYAAQRDPSESPTSKTALSPIRVPKRRMSNLGSQERSTKRIRSGIDIGEKIRFYEGRREESMSEQGRNIQNLTRQEFQKRYQKKLGITMAETEDSIELESRRMPGKTGLGNSDKLVFGKRLPKSVERGKVIPIKMGRGLPTDGTDDSISLSSSRDFSSVAIQPPSLSAAEPSIILVPGDEPVLPQDKKIPTKHTPKPSGSRALVIPAAKPAKIIAATRKVSARSVQMPPSPTKLPASSHRSANFTAGSMQATTKSNVLRKSQRTVNKTSSIVCKTSRANVASATRAGVGKELTIRTTNIDIQVPVKFDCGSGKRKYAEVDVPSPSKRIKLSKDPPSTPARTLTPSTALVRHPTANRVAFTPGAVSSRTALPRGYGNRRSVSSRPPWR